MEVPQPIIELLQSLNSGNNEQIKKGEELYNQLKRQQPDLLISSFITLIRTSQNEALRSYPPVLLRTLVNGVDSGNILSSLKPETIGLLKAELVNAVYQEPKNYIRHSILNVIAVLAIYLIPKQQWTEVLEFIVQSAKDQNENLRESAFFLIGAIIDDPSVSQALSPSFPVFAELAKKGLEDPSTKVKVASLETISSFIDANPEQAEVFKQLIGLMLQAVQKAIESNLEKEAQKAILAFIIIVQYHPDWFKAEFNLVFKTFFGFLESKALEDETRHTVLHFFLTVAEVKSSLMKKAEYLEPLVLLLLKWMSTVEDIDFKEWNSLETEPTEDDDPNVALEAIESLSHCISKGLWDFFGKCAPTLIKSNNWKERYTFLMTLSAISEGCQKKIKQNFKLLIEHMTALAKDQHPRVRFAFFYCLGSLSTSIKREVQDAYKVLIPIALEHLNDPFSRVIISDCEFLTLFLDEIKTSRVKEFKDQFLAGLSPLLQSNDYKIVQHSLNAFSSVVDGIGEDFTKHYGEIMPFLIKIIQTQTSQETKTLRGRAIETISLIGLAVGKKVFIRDCIEIINYISSLPKLPDDDPQVDFFLRAFTRFAQCLGEDFVPYLPNAMSPLMDAINGKVEIEESNEYADSIGSSGTVVMENKAMALEMVSIYCMELKIHLFPYVEKLYSGSISLIDFAYNSIVPIQAVNLIPYLVKICRGYYESQGVPNGMASDYTAKIYNDAFERLVASIKIEAEPEIASAKLKALADLLDIGGGFEPTKILNATFDAVRETFTNLQEIEDEYQQGIDAEDEDADEAPEREIIDDAYNSLAMVLGEVCIQYKAAAVPYIKEVLVTINDLIEKAPSVEIKTSMICILDDLIENGGPDAYLLYPHIIIPMLKCASATDEDPSLIQSAVFGLGLAAENGKEYFSQFLMKSLEVLVGIINRPTSDDEEVAARDNSISAMGRMIVSLPAHLGNNLPASIDAWLSYLPIQDEGEAHSIIKSLGFLIQTYPQLVLTENKIVRILEVIAVGLIRNVIDENEKAAFVNALSPFKNQIIQQFGNVKAEYREPLNTLLK
ncbi:hypothetical protein DICPUDRAFT_150414 [Dictyostelium purpureum]|uniref:Importin N-terminal domain-containing protein n=1 Tax=Dictyostelium purpureum TaxID=5786 RepID=F0ZG98_DICPU|nr:uncharacterized protein DICPUDRAFT_150414 [Dictyostelium purpureum]EGC37022.1 hypothetical protein DICPUDRAFT_150414 [Dictyostelium purpureum]|eukprot:XP_003286450.1 hypothetical protein DICPUDRAFT_150414 [Dictyostelium purpureum]